MCLLLFCLHGTFCLIYLLILICESFIHFYDCNAGCCVAAEKALFLGRWFFICPTLWKTLILNVYLCIFVTVSPWLYSQTAFMHTYRAKLRTTLSNLLCTDKPTIVSNENRVIDRTFQHLKKKKTLGYQSGSKILSSSKNKKKIYILIYLWDALVVCKWVNLPRGVPCCWAHCLLFAGDSTSVLHYSKVISPSCGSRWEFMTYKQQMPAVSQPRIQYTSITGKS